MSKANNLIRLLGEVAYSPSPLTKVQDYTTRCEYPVVAVSSCELSAYLLKLFKRNYIRGSICQLFKAPYSMKLEQYLCSNAVLKDKIHQYSAFSFEGNLILTDGRFMYSPSQETLIFLLNSNE